VRALWSVPAIVAIAIAIAPGCGGSPAVPDGAPTADAVAAGDGAGAGADGAAGPDGAPGPDGSGTPDASPAAADASAGAADAAPALTCAKALLYNDCDPGLDANCFSIAEPLRSDDAAVRLGLATAYGGGNDQPAVRALFDAGGFDVIVFESSSNLIDAATANRLAAWIAGGGALVFSYWDLDGSSSAGPAATLRAALGVTTPASFDTPRTVHTDPAAPVDFFDRVETFPSPLGFSNIGLDDGDELATSGGGFLAAHLSSATGPGAIAVTHGGRVVVLGFLPIELVYQVVRDADADGTADVEELYTNTLAYLCGS